MKQYLLWLCIAALYSSTNLWLPARMGICAELPPAKLTVGEPSALKITLRTDKTRYFSGEPIALHATLLNPTPTTVSCRLFQWYPAGGGSFEGHMGPQIELEVSRDGRQFETYMAGNILAQVVLMGGDELLGRDEVRRAKTVLLFRAHRLAHFDAPGALTLRARYWPRSRREAEVRSNPVTIRIRAPEGDDATFWKVLKDRYLLDYFGYSLRHSSSPSANAIDVFKSVAAEFETLAAKYPRSAYAPHALFAAGQAWLNAKEYERARTPLRRVREHYPRCSIAEDALYLLAESHMLVRQHVEAHRYYKELSNCYPETLAADEARKRIPAVEAASPDFLFPDDRRLDAKIQYHFPDPTPIDKVLEVISAAGGVPLRASPETAVRRLHGRPASQTLREFMHERAMGGFWVAEPDGGYRLMRNASRPETFPKPRRKPPAKAPDKP